MGTISKNKYKTLGIIGGMGPQATADLFYKIIKLTPANKDQEHIRIIIDNFPQIPDRTDFILNQGQDPKPYLLQSANLLKKAGAEILLMPCNTAHYFLPYLQKETQLPFISIIDSAISQLGIQAPKAKKIAVLSTKGTKAIKIYENALIKQNYTVVDLGQEIEMDIMSAIYDGVKKGKTKDLIHKFQKTIDHINNEVSPDAMLAACTEIPILMEFCISKTPIIDATLSLAQAAVDK
ncbi:MAG: amino acid racemase, partial [Elusimicrobiota bacterium]|nr:amino acid racemase [Elusimicrobiota bacterium]